MENDNIITPFISLIYKNKVEDNLLKKTFLNILNDQKKNKSNQVSNVGGFQTFPLTKELNLLADIFNFHFSEFSRFLKPKKKITCKIENYWINENKNNDFNKFHHHLPGPNFSLVWYLESTGEGPLNFFNNDLTCSMTGNNDFFEQGFNYEYIIYPKTDDILIFPSNMLHCVYPNHTQNRRVSLAANIFIV